MYLKYLQTKGFLYKRMPITILLNSLFVVTRSEIVTCIQIWVFIFLIFSLYVAVFKAVTSSSDSNDTASETPTTLHSGMPDSQETTGNSLSASQNIARTTTTTRTHLSEELDNSISKINIAILSDLSVSPNTTQLQKSTELPLSPTKLSTNSPNGRSLKEAFLFVYGVYRLRYKCPVSMCNPDAYNTTLTGYILDVSFSLEYSCCSGCSCDENCERRGDCCPDRIQSVFEPDRYPVGGAMGCHQNSLKDFPRFDETMSGYFISKCDVTFIDRVTISACEKPKTNLLQNLVPVSDENTKEAYKNKHCAICNYVKESNILYWDLKLACSDSSFIPNTLSNIIAQVRAQPKCNILFIPPSPRKKYQPAYCSEVTSACNVSGDWDLYDPLVEAGCAAYLSPFYDVKGTFRNIFCYLCNFPNSDYSPSCISKKEHPVFPFPSFAALLDFRPVQTRSSVMANDDSQSFNCTSGFVYDHYQGKCLEMVCPAMTEIQGENCEKIMHSVAGLCLEAYVKIKPFEPVYGDIFDKSIYIFITKTLLTCDWVNMHISMYYQPACGVSNVRHCIMEREYIVLYITTNDLDCLGALTSLDKRDMLLNETGFSINATIHVYDVMSEILEKTDAKEATYIGDLLMPVRGTEALHPCRFTSKPLTVSKFLVCPAVRLKIKDISMFLRNGSIHIPEIGLTLSKRDFMVDRNGIMVCIDDYIPSTRSFVIDDTKHENRATDGEQTNFIGFTTLICVCSSIVSLIITLAVYLFIPQLRTQPGINNMFLSVSLLLALIMFQFGAGRTENQITCTVIGVTIHFLWLNNIFWMNICCYHMFRVFSSIRLTSLNNASTRTTLKYCLYCISLSSVFVVINVMYSLSNEKNGTIGYGKRANMCYIKSPIMVAFTMTLPTSMIVLINFAMYTKVICCISRNRFEAILSRKHNRNFTMYVKLSTLTGLAWLSYVPVYFTDRIAIEIIFSALVTCQGVFIMIAFVCNKRVYRAFKNKLTGREPGSSSSKYTSSSKDTAVSTITRS